MTDRETIFIYRMKQTEETLVEAVKMLESGFSARSIVNRSYYAMFLRFWHFLFTQIHLTKHPNIRGS